MNRFARSVSILVFTMLAMGCATPTPGYSAASLEDGELAILVDQVSQGGARFVKSIEQVDGLQGVVIEAKNRPGVYTVGWATPSGKHLLVGNYYDIAGVDETMRAFNEYVQGEPLGRDAFYDRVARASAVTQFPGGQKTLYVFLDADCVFCHEMFKTVLNMEDEFKAASVRIRWIIVGTLGRESAMRGAAILQKGYSGLLFNENNYDYATHIGGIQPVADSELLTKVDQNTQLLLSSGESPATPTIVYQSADGVQIVVGALDERMLATVLQQILPD